MNLKDQIKKSLFLTQERFAQAVGISEPRMSKFCRGLVKPTPEEEARIEKKLTEVPKEVAGLDDLAGRYLASDKNWAMSRSTIRLAVDTNCLLAGLLKELQNSKEIQKGE